MSAHASAPCNKDTRICQRLVLTCSTAHFIAFRLSVDLTKQQKENLNVQTHLEIMLITINEWKISFYTLHCRGKVLLSTIMRNKMMSLFSTCSTGLQYIILGVTSSFLTTLKTLSPHTHAAGTHTQKFAKRVKKKACLLITNRKSHLFSAHIITHSLR